MHRYGEILKNYIFVISLGIFLAFGCRLLEQSMRSEVSFNTRDTMCGVISKFHQATRSTKHGKRNSGWILELTNKSYGVEPYYLDYDYSVQPLLRNQSVLGLVACIERIKKPLFVRYDFVSEISLNGNNIIDHNLVREKYFEDIEPISIGIFIFSSVFVFLSIFKKFKGFLWH